MWCFYNFNFERNYDVLKSKSPCILLNKNINFNKRGTELKMENPTYSFRVEKTVDKTTLPNSILKFNSIF